MSGIVRMGQRIAFGCAVTFSIGQKFKNRRHRSFEGILGHPDPGRQLHAVGEGNKSILNLPYVPWKFVNNFDVACVHVFS